MRLHDPRLTDNDRIFIGQVVQDLSASRSDFIMRDSSNLAKYGGWFEYSPRRLCLARDGDYSYEVLIHEYAHYIQWKERPSYFRRNGSLWLTLNEYFEGVKVIKIASVIQKLMLFEADCEREACKLIRKRKLTVNGELYVRLANVSMVSYLYALRHKCFPKKVYTSKALRAAMYTGSFWPQVSNDAVEKILNSWPRPLQATPQS